MATSQVRNNLLGAFEDDGERLGGDTPSALGTDREGRAFVESSNCGGCVIEREGFPGLLESSVWSGDSDLRAIRSDGRASHIPSLRPKFGKSNSGLEAKEFPGSFWESLGSRFTDS